MDTIAKVRRAHVVDKNKIKAIARELRLSRNTVRSIVRAEEETERREQPMPQLGPYVRAVDAMLAANAKRSKRGCLIPAAIIPDSLASTGTRSAM